MKVIILIVTLFLSSHISAEWVKLSGKEAQMSQREWNLPHQTEGKYKLIWERFVVMVPNKKTDWDGIRAWCNPDRCQWNAGHWLIGAVLLIKYDCSALKEKIIKGYNKGFNGDTTNHRDAKNKWNYFEPDSITYKRLTDHLVCKK